MLANHLGWSDIGCYGGEIRTLHIDSLARDGLRFRQFYNNAICGPTRASLLTGLYCQQVGHRGDRWNEPKDFRKCATIAELLQSAGYRTMMVGKWQGRDLAVDRGFDQFFGPLCQAKISYFHEVDQNFYVRDWQSDSYKDWQAERMAVYAAQVETIDRGLGELLETVNRAGQADNTLVLFLSDNGAAPDGGLAPTASGFGFGPNAKNDRWRKDGVPIRPGSGPDNLPGPHDTFAAYGLAWANVSNTPLRGTKLTDKTNEGLHDSTT